MLECCTRQPPEKGLADGNPEYCANGSYHTLLSLQASIEAIEYDLSYGHLSFTQRVHEQSELIRNKHVDDALSNQ